jgi:UDP-N-acetylmuramyl pentapeptide phosphotransferase/UDP-N-acetylglucosamine-1-phosphate transferase
LPGIAWKWPPWLGIGVLLLFIIWMINLYNFMDGMDGFAGGMAVIGFGAYAIFGWIGGQPLFFIVSLVICAAAAGFLISNFPPAKIFLGDAGSASLGLLAAGLSLWGARDGLFPLWVALLIFSPFIADATVTLLRRLLKGEKVWEAHRSHCYQRLVQAGWGHRKTLLWEYSLMLACAATGLLVTHRSAETQLFALALWTGIYLFLFRAVKWAEHRSLGAK